MKFDDEHWLKEYTGEDREVTVPDTLMGSWCRRCGE